MKKEVLSVSVVMPIKYKHEYIEKTLESIFNQKDNFSELIIICDGCEKEHLNHVQKILKNKLENDKFRIIKNTNIEKGPGSARDIGIKKARSEYIAFIDDDDIWPKNYLKFRAKFIEKENSFFSASPYSYVNKELKVLKSNYFSKQKIKRKDILFNNPIGNSTVIVKRSFILKLGGYSHLKKRNDYSTWIKLLKYTNCDYCREVKPVKILRRINSLSNNKFLLIRFQYLAYRQSGLNLASSLFFTIFSIIMGLKNEITKYINTFKNS